MVGSGSLDDIEVTDEEREVMRECVREAFWFRSLPASIITGTCFFEQQCSLLSFNYQA